MQKKEYGMILYIAIALFVGAALYFFIKKILSTPKRMQSRKIGAVIGKTDPQFSEKAFTDWLKRRWKECTMPRGTAT